MPLPLPAPQPLPPEANNTASNAPSHWCAQHYSYEAAEALAPHMRPGGPVRLAMLQCLAYHPDGVSQAALLQAAYCACKGGQPKPSDDDMRVICGHLASLGQMVVELVFAHGLVYVCPATRRVARQRRQQGYTLPAVLQMAQVKQVVR